MSVPVPAGVKRAATAAAEPPDEAFNVFDRHLRVRISAIGEYLEIACRFIFELFE